MVSKMRQTLNEYYSDMRANTVAVPITEKVDYSTYSIYVRNDAAYTKNLWDSYTYNAKQYYVNKSKMDFNINWSA